MSDDTAERDDIVEIVTKAQRLYVAGSVAPTLRSQSERAKSRRVARVDADGKVVGYTTLAEVQKALLLERQIELEVVDGVRPKEVVCKACGLPVRVTNRKGVVPKVCQDGCRCATDGCQNRVGPGGAANAVRQKRRATCLECATAERMRRMHAAAAAIPSERRSEISRRVNAARTAEQRSDSLRKAWATRRGTKGKPSS